MQRTLTTPKIQLTMAKLIKEAVIPKEGIQLAESYMKCCPVSVIITNLQNHQAASSGRRARWAQVWSESEKPRHRCPLAVA